MKKNVCLYIYTHKNCVCVCIYVCVYIYIYILKTGLGLKQKLTQHCESAICHYNKLKKNKMKHNKRSLKSSRLSKAS